MRRQEHDLQAACVRWFRFQYPDEVLFSVPNGAFLFGRDPAARARQWKKLKAEGALEGVADLFLARRTPEYGGLFIETKVGSNGQSKNQKWFEKQVRKKGYQYVIVKDIDTFIEIVSDYISALP